MEEYINELITQEQKEVVEDIRKLIEEEAYEKLFEKYDEILDLSDVWDDASEMEDEEIDAELLIVWYLASEDILLGLDWSGEDDDGEVSGFVNRILKDIYSLDFKVDDTDIYEIFEKGKYNGSLIKRGEHLPILFSELNKQLLQKDLEIVSFDTGSDEYYIGILKKELVDKIIDYEFDYIEIETFR